MKSKGSGKEYLLEFVVQGAYVRCCAIDPITGTEAVAVEQMGAEIAGTRGRRRRGGSAWNDSSSGQTS